MINPVPVSLSYDQATGYIKANFEDGTSESIFITTGSKFLHDHGYKGLTAQNIREDWANRIINAYNGNGGGPIKINNEDIANIRGLTPNLIKLYRYIERSINAYGYAPTIQEISDHFSLKSRGSIHKRINALVDMGLLKKDAHLKKRNILLNEK